MSPYCIQIRTDDQESGNPQWLVVNNDLDGMDGEREGPLLCLNQENMYHYRVCGDSHWGSDGPIVRKAQ